MAENKQPAALGLAKSSRLLSLAGRSSVETKTPVITKKTMPEQDQSWLIQLLDQRLAEVTNALPQGKKQRFFKIRYGFELSDLSNMEIGVLVKMLNIRDPKLLSPTPVIKALLAQTYGEIVSS